MRQRIVVLDGAMGTMIQRYKLTGPITGHAASSSTTKDVKGNNELLLLSKPEVIREITSSTWPLGPT